MDKIILETERMYLREMSPEDFKAICLIMQDEQTMQAYNGAFADCDIRTWIERQLQRYDTYGYGLWAAIRKDSGELIGQCGLTRQYWLERQVIEVGYLFRRDHWHKGYATEAAKACKTYAFGQLEANRLCAIIRDTNTSSQRVAQRIGMTRRPGIMVKHYRGTDMPHYLFAVEKY